MSRSGWLRTWIWITSDAATRRPAAFAVVNDPTAIKNTAKIGRISMCVFVSVQWWHSIQRPGKRHKADEHNGARLRLTRCDLFYHGELRCGVGGPQWHYKPATTIERRLSCKERRAPSVRKRRWPARGVSFPASRRCLSRVGHNREIIEISTA